MLDLASKDERIVLVFGDISVYLFNDFQKKFPDRFYNMGICENTLISVAAGLSSQGFIPVVHTIAPFITERSFEQIKLDFSYNQFFGNIVSCGATFDYAWDGATHHCLTDLATLRLLPDFEVFQPGTFKEADFLLRNYYNSKQSTYFRLSDHPHPFDFDLQKGKGIVVKNKGADTTVITAGPLLDYVFKACDDLDVNLLYFHTLKPFDNELISTFSDTELKVVHDSHGLFESVCEVSGRSVKCLTLPDRFCCSYGTIHDVRKNAGLDIHSIKQFIANSL